MQPDVAPPPGGDTAAEPLVASSWAISRLSPGGRRSGWHRRSKPWASRGILEVVVGNHHSSPPRKTGYDPEQFDEQFHHRRLAAEVMSNTERSRSEHGPHRHGRFGEPVAMPIWMPDRWRWDRVSRRSTPFRESGADPFDKTSRGDGVVRAVGAQLDPVARFGNSGGHRTGTMSGNRWPFWPPALRLDSSFETDLPQTVRTGRGDPP